MIIFKDSSKNKDERGIVFFNVLIQLNLTTNTLIWGCLARFLFLAPIAKYLDEIFPDPDQSGAGLWDLKF